MNWVRDSLNETATSADPDNKTPFETWHGEYAKLQALPALQPGYYHATRKKKSDSKLAACFVLGPAPRRALGLLATVEELKREPIGKHQ